MNDRSCPKRTENIELGVSPVDGGAEIGVYSGSAEFVELCVFDVRDNEAGRYPLTRGDDGIWRGFAAGLKPGDRYGFRAHGPYDPQRGLLFNANKVLIDPYARDLSGELKQGAALSHDNKEDSAALVPKSVVVDTGDFDWGADAPPRTPFDETIIYEAHVRNLTMRHPGVPEALRGTYEGLGCPAVIEHLAALGVTAVELLPIHSFVDESFLVDRGLRNHWGYNTVGYFAPERRYFGPNGADGLKTSIKALHAAGIEVILDVVYNHTAESGLDGPTLMFRGLDNPAYYRLDAEAGYVNDTGCGNTMRCDHPIVMRLIMDSLRHWVADYRIDGFRFDLATVLGRAGEGGFDPDAPLLHAMRNDPVLSQVKLIAEPWDIGPGGYRLGEFPPGYAEWNDRFRDDTRMFWRNDRATGPGLATRLMGSADRFDRDGRAAWSSINAVTAHDGFTLADLVSFADKHNEANGEENRDGHHTNFSSNGGFEGPTDRPAILAERDRRRRNLVATLLLSQGTPMLLAGDEIGNSQNGNNNAYCQDNEISWLDWENPDQAFLAFVQRLVAVRRAHPALRQTHFLHGKLRPDGTPDLTWIGFEDSGLDWTATDFRQFALHVRISADAPPGVENDDIVIAVNGSNESGCVMLPEVGTGLRWQRIVSTDDPEAENVDSAAGPVTVEAQTVVAFALTSGVRS